MTILSLNYGLSHTEVPEQREDEQAMEKEERSGNTHTGSFDGWQRAQSSSGVGGEEAANGARKTEVTLEMQNCTRISQQTPVPPRIKRPMSLSQNNKR